MQSEFFMEKAPYKGDWIRDFLCEHEKALCKGISLWQGFLLNCKPHVVKGIPYGKGSLLNYKPHCVKAVPYGMAVL